MESSPPGSLQLEHPGGDLDQQLIADYLEEHPEFKCQFCPKTFDKSGSMTKHARRSHKDQVHLYWPECHFCGMHFPDEDKVMFHQRKHCKSIKKDLKIRCHFCLLRFNNRANMLRHARKGHLNQVMQSWLSCQTCGLQYPDAKSLKSHRIKKGCQVSQVGKSCQFCPEMFSRTRLYQHARDNHEGQVNEYWIPCPGCKLRYPTKDIMVQHRNSSCIKWKEMTKMKRLVDDQTATRIIIPNGTKKATQSGFKCQFCSKCFTGIGTMLIHGQNQHEEEIARHWELICLNCTKRFPNQDLLHKHLLKDHCLAATIRCTYCDLKFSNRRQMYVHARKSHADQVLKLWLSCPKCELKYPDETSRNRHVTNNCLIGKDLSCHKCNTQFTTIKQMRKHARQNHPDDHDPLKKPRTVRTIKAPILKECPFCSKKLLCTPEMVDHANFHHEAQVFANWAPCQKCNKCFPSQAHLDQHHEYPCQDASKFKAQCVFCPRKFPQLSSMYRHARHIHQEKVSKEWKSCSSCRLGYPDHKSKESHMISTHKLYPCEFCTLASQSPSDLKMHLQDEHITFMKTKLLLNKNSSVACIKEKSVKCEFCPKMFDYESQMGVHANIQHEAEVLANWVQCINCCKCFSTEELLKQHHQRNPCVDASTFKRKCYFCIRKFPSFRVMYRHARSVHREKVSDEWKSCSICGLGYPDYKSKESHMIKTHKLYPCEFCTLVSQSTFDLKMHLHDEHPDKLFLNKDNSVKEKSVKCEFCPKMFDYESQMGVHANSQHEAEVLANWVQCFQCFKCFPSKEFLKQHQKNPCVDASTLKRKCDFCVRKFPSMRMMYRHARSVHHDQVLVQWKSCSECELMYPNRISKERHMLKKHGLYPCEVCPSVFEDVQLLKQHLHERHPNHQPVSSLRMSLLSQQVQCPFCPKVMRYTKEMVSHAQNIHHAQVLAKWKLCLKCSKGFPTQELLDQHLPCQSICKVKCAFCPMGFSLCQFMYKHARSVHKDQVLDHWKKCPGCESSYPDGNSFESHKDNCKAFKISSASGESCDVCQKSFPSKLRLRKHRLQDHPEVVTDIVVSSCPFCQKGFNISREMMIHARLEHKSEVAEIWSNCTTCKKYFPPRRFHVHVQNCTSGSGKSRSGGDKVSRITPCKFCFKKFSIQRDAYIHSRKEHKDQVQASWFPCADCGEYYPTETSLKTHHYTKHLWKDTATTNTATNTTNGEGVFDVQSTRTRSESKPVNVVQPHQILLEEVEEDTALGLDESTGPKCEFCLMSFKGTLARNNHAREQHKEDVLTYWVPCPSCGQHYRNLKAVRSHQYQKGCSNFSCQFCNKVFRTLKDYLKHAKKDHTTDVEHSWKKCQFCHGFWPDNRLLKNHIVMCIILQCQFCHSHFKSKNHAKNVIRYIDHANDEHLRQASNMWIQCPSCEIHIPDIKYLAIHREGNQCHQMMDQADDSIEIHDIISVESCYTQCIECGQLFQNIVEHQKTTSCGMALFPKCDLCSQYFRDSQCLLKHQITCIMTFANTVKEEPPQQLSRVTNNELNLDDIDKQLSWLCETKKSYDHLHEQFLAK